MIPCPRQARGSDQSYKGTSTTMLCRETSTVWGYSGSAYFATGDKRSSNVVKDTGTPGFVVSSWPHNGFLNLVCSIPGPLTASPRSEEHTSELQSLRHLVCRLLLEKKIRIHTGRGASTHDSPPSQ